MPTFRLEFNFVDVVGDRDVTVGLFNNWLLPVKAEAVDRSRQIVAINRLVMLCSVLWIRPEKMKSAVEGTSFVC